MSDWNSEKAPGEWFGGDSAESLPAELVAGPQVLVVSTHAGVVARWTIADLRIDTMHDGDLAHLECDRDPDRLVVTRDVAFVAHLRARGARSDGLPRGRRGLFIGLLCAAGAAGIFAGLYVTAPWVSRRIAEQVPLSLERRLRSDVEEVFTRHACETPEARHALDSLKARLDPAGATPATVRITNVKLPNAFALPGGDVLLARGLLEEAKSADEVAGVLAHELAHVQHRHVLAQLIETTFLGSVWALTVGDYSGLLAIDPKALYQLLSLGHSRDAESEADSTGAQLLRRAGVSTAGLIAFLERNREEREEIDALSFVSTHPASKDRVASLQGGNLAGSQPALGATAFAALQAACAGQPAAPSLLELFD